MKSKSKKKELERAKWLTSIKGADLLNRREKFALTLIWWFYKAKIIDIMELGKRTSMVLDRAIMRVAQEKGGLKVVLLDLGGKNEQKDDD